MKFSVEITCVRQATEIRRCTIDIEADDPVLARELAKETARCQQNGLPWGEPIWDRVHDGETSFQVGDPTMLDPPPVVAGEHGLQAVCGHCQRAQNCIPTSGPWRCRAFNRVNSRAEAP